MNTVILIFHFPFFKYNISILSFIFASFPVTGVHFCINIHAFYITGVLLLPPFVCLIVNRATRKVAGGFS